MAEGARLESLVEYILQYVGAPYSAEKRVEFRKSDGEPAGTLLLDFMAEWQGEKVAIEVMAGRLFPERFERAFRLHRMLGTGGTASLLLLVVERPLTPRMQAWLDGRQRGGIPMKVLSVAQLPAWFGREMLLDLSDERALDALRLAAHAPSSAAPEARLASAMAEGAQAGAERQQLQNLKRFFDDRVVDRLAERPDSLVEKLKIGRVVEDVTVLMSDIKNFSSFVKHAPADRLNEAMGGYYRAARRIVWNHGGVLDKFIGDAVLAIFGYPEADPLSARRAAQCGRDLVLLGDRIVGDLMRNINDVIESGTRVGLATGEVRVMNLSDDGIEPTFVGDVINRAARLEKECGVNRILMDQVTYRRIEDDREQDDVFPTPDDFMRGILESSKAKGQVHDQWSWSVDCGTPPPLSDLIAQLRGGKGVAQDAAEPVDEAEAMAEAEAGEPVRPRPRGRAKPSG